jgi:thioredoxin 1
MPTLTLTQNNFDATVISNHIVLVDWFAPWCGPSRSFMPVFEASAELHPEVVHGTVDGDAEPSLIALAKVEAYPTVMAFREGMLVHAQAGSLAAGELEDLVQQVLWLDMDQFRFEMKRLSTAHEEPIQEANEPTIAAPHRRLAGHAVATDRYGWPGL